MKALILIDIQNDFVKPGGALYFAGAERVIAPALSHLEEHLKAGSLIITTQDWHEPDDDEFKLWPPHCVRDTEGAELVEQIKEKLAGYSKHISIKKNRYSAFYGTDLEQKLKEFGITEVDVCGVVTHICVLFTVEELRNRGLKVKVFKDSVASYDHQLHEFALRMMREILGAEVV
ncbi:cysteine hydrolase family protein [Pseudothermotoga thermarum]|uniref:Isochorismatase hydrolase n=1 Tax=Pseudothermotoga thermarum DSM 5069 TaxID=688269 RepID=F7YW98_9THEM|nr:isochorismatase family cysteine hydrolase [Pseudothermotoga thermarum]AEH51870.1 isochorismatase hydrolase [Pseudothermotoga thermarum DSM 5069]